MYHSITFGKKNTWDDWHLIPSTRPTINPPKRVDKIVTLPGVTGAIDMSNYLANFPNYSNRTGNFTFEVVNGYRDWMEAYTDIGNYLRDKYTTVILEDDPDYYYWGKVSLDTWTSNKNWSEISIAYDLYPFRHPINLPPEFENIDLSSGDKQLTFEGTVEYASPYVEVEGASDTGIRLYHTTDDPTNTLTAYNGKMAFAAYNGRQLIHGLKLGPGEHTITFSGTGKVKFDYRGGIV